MKKIAVAVLSLALPGVCLSSLRPAQKVAQRPAHYGSSQAVHQKNEQLKHAPKHKAQKRPHNA